MQTGPNPPALGCLGFGPPDLVDVVVFSAKEASLAPQRLSTAGKSIQQYFSQPVGSNTSPSCFLLFTQWHEGQVEEFAGSTQVPLNGHSSTVEKAWIYSSFAQTSMESQVSNSGKKSEGVSRVDLASSVRSSLNLWGKGMGGILIIPHVSFMFLSLDGCVMSKQALSLFPCAHLLFSSPASLFDAFMGQQLPLSHASVLSLVVVLLDWSYFITPHLWPVLSHQSSSIFALLAARSSVTICDSTYTCVAVCYALVPSFNYLTLDGSLVLACVFFGVACLRLFVAFALNIASSSNRWSIPGTSFVY